MEKYNNTNAELEAERKLSEGSFKEVKDKYPTIESMVDDYRKGMITIGDVAFRFPDQSDQDEVIKLAGERNQAENI